MITMLLVNSGMSMKDGRNHSKIRTETRGYMFVDMAMLISIRTAKMVYAIC